MLLKWLTVLLSQMNSLLRDIVLFSLKPKKYLILLLLFLWLFPSSGVAAMVVDHLFPVKKCLILLTQKNQIEFCSGKTHFSSIFSIIHLV